MSKLMRKLAVIGEQDSVLLKVAFASADGETVDQHFGSAKSLTIYGIDPENSQLLAISEFGDLKQDGNEDKLSVKLGVLDGCIAVYCRACGASAVKQLLAREIQPVKVSEGTSIRDLVADLQQELREGPSAWLARALERNKPDPSRFDDMELEGWEE